jgi:hypothetical protein
MPFRTLRFLSLLFLVLTLGASLAHLYAMPNKMQFSREEYLTAQQIYRGWILVGLVNIPALLCIAILAFRVRGIPRVGGLTMAAAVFACLAFAIFMAFTFPANRATGNWTELAGNWESLRAQWEYSHAAGAVLYLLSFVLLAWSILSEQNSLVSGVPLRQ